jgi:hypothetical protein
MTGKTLILDGNRLRVTGSATGETEAACAWICPPAHVEDSEISPTWTLTIDTAPLEDDVPQPAAWTMRMGTGGWPRIAVVENDGDRMRAVGQYRRGDAPVRIDVDRHARATTTLIPKGVPGSARWPDWLVRVYFGTHMLAAGWRLLHACAISIDGRAVIIGGSAGAGKSSLAHLACAQLGATFMADDLTLIASAEGPAAAVGWPTRICPPVGLMTFAPHEPRESRTTSAGWRRERLVLSPARYAEATGFRRGGCAPVAAAVLLAREPEPGGVHRLAAEPDQQMFMTDTLGLMGPPASVSGAAEPDAVARILHGVPVIHIESDLPAMALAPTVWAALPRDLGTAVAG